MDIFTPEKRSRIMRGVKSKDTKPEMIVRRLLHSLGYRYRVHQKGIPGKPDLVFVGRRKVVFVHGCFWHQHASKDCHIVRRPSSNTSFWNAKLDRNIQRDKDVQLQLREMGWEAITVWECQTQDLEALRDRLVHFIGERRQNKLG